MEMENLMEGATEELEKTEADISEENLMEGAAEELEKAKAAISAESKAEQEYKDTERSLKAKQKELEIQRKRVEEKINSAIKKARAELDKGYDEQINLAGKAIKEAETMRKNAKASAVSERMQRENSALIDENKLLAAEIKEKFKAESIPGFCKSGLYYALFCPSKPADYFICIAAILITCGLFPFIITRFFSTTLVKVLVWIIIAALFAAVYFLIFSWTRKGNKQETIINMRSSVERISENRKFIKKRNKNIKADPDESQYNLAPYDEQVSVAKAQYDAAVSNKEEAVRQFEEVESVDIREQMQEEKAPVFTELEKEIEQMTNDLSVKTYQNCREELEKFSSVLGEKLMRADKLDELAALINEGKAQTIQEAIDAQKSK